MKTLLAFITIGLLTISTSSMAWWGPFDNEHDRYDNRWNSNNNNNWNNRLDNNAFGDFMGDMMGDMSGDMDVEIKFKIRGKGRADGRGYGYNDNYWNNSYRYYNNNRYGTYAPQGYQPHYRQPPAQPAPALKQQPKIK